MALEEYDRKRDFKKTREPAGRRAVATESRFVIQKHDASRLHYDFRLEMGGVLKSWAVPKGLPYEKGEKRLAVHVEDHPVAYIDFEGTIPEGQYGGGTVMVWDRGTFEPLSKAPEKELADGKLHFILSGEKLRGEWYLVRLRDEDQWLMIKGGDDLKPLSKKVDDTSVASGKSMKELSRGDRIWQSKSTTETVKKSRAKGQPAKKVGEIALPEFVEPMKAKLLAEPPHGQNWIYEIKFDGWRALAIKGGSQTRLLSRNQLDMGGKFPEIMDSLDELEVEDAIIDGEIVALDDQGKSSFQLLQAYDLGDQRPPIFFYAFDLIRLNGKSLTSLPLAKRKEKLAKLLQTPPGAFRYSANLGNDVSRLLQQAQQLGLEGLIGKKSESTYEIGKRSGAWIKLKLLAEQEFVIGGYTNPSGSRRHFGALLVGYFEGKKLKFAGKVGTGFNEKLLQSLKASFDEISTEKCPFWDLPEKRDRRWGQVITASQMKLCHWVKPTMVCQIKFAEWTREERLRQPVFLGLRKDKVAMEVSRERPT